MKEYTIKQKRDFHAKCWRQLFGLLFSRNWNRAIMAGIWKEIVEIGCNHRQIKRGKGQIIVVQCKSVKRQELEHRSSLNSASQNRKKGSQMAFISTRRRRSQSKGKPTFILLISQSWPHFQVRNGQRREFFLTMEPSSIVSKLITVTWK